ncbi:hypothetical protein GF359_05905 [candidate division WOR-3 bacterium]|uniref:Permease n=1 Tax=candidate division WOR-3 bacterium TaxID=2052148 RepID=A0A9D5K993_UNCW3|nr:hypothetical protein [candidate division WOR-3 bacterium]MBD3364732.1 hypothetical protein [candidate division WOR-3 bacterium]
MLASLLGIVESGVLFVFTYFARHLLIAIIPACFLTGALQVFLPSRVVTRYLKRPHRAISSWTVAAVSGTLLTVSSKQVVPLFADVRKGGVSLGPSMVLLFAGPALNILTLALTVRILGWDYALARFAGAFCFSLVIGLGMVLIWRKREVPAKIFRPVKHRGFLKSFSWRRYLLFGLLSCVLIFSLLQPRFERMISAKGGLDTLISLLPVSFFILGTITAALLCIRCSMGNWLGETWLIIRTMCIRLIAGVFIAGVFREVVPYAWIEALVGGEGIIPNLFAAIFGSFIHFATLTEVPITSVLLEMGMGKGPALTFLLSGPALSLSNLIAIRKVAGSSRTLTYMMLVIAATTMAGLVYGLVV